MITPNWSDKTILIVEDDEISKEFLTELLFPSQVNILTAKNGEEAIEVCKDNTHISLVLMDVRLPLMNGEMAMKQIKKEFPELPIIAQTAFAMSGDKENYLNSGFDDYIPKPIQMQDLLDKIARFI